MKIGKRKPKPEKKPEKKPVYKAELGSGFFPGLSGSSLWPDSARVRIEKDNDGVWRPVRHIGR